MKNEKQNVFEKAENEIKSEAIQAQPVESVKQEEVKEALSSNEQEINLDEDRGGKYVKLPNADKIGEDTGELKVKKYYSKLPEKRTNKETGETYMSGLKSKDGKNHGEFLINVEHEGEIKTLTLSNFECKIKFDTLMSYLRANALATYGQIIKFKRIAEGAKSSKHDGVNWELYAKQATVKVVGVDNKIVKLE